MRPAAAGTDADADGRGTPGTPGTPGPDAKRKKTRNGTHSCWACKRRKERCIFDSQISTSTDHAATCLGCQRRGTPCVSQEFPDDFSAPPDGARQMGDHLVRLEAQMENLSRRFGSDDAVSDWASSSLDAGGRHDHGIPMPASTVPDSPRGARSRGNAPAVSSARASSVENDRTGHDQSRATRDARTGRLPNVVLAGPAKHARLSRILHDALPSSEDTDVICRASHRSFYMFNEILTVPSKTLDQDGLTSPEDILVRPGQNAHPVLIAKHMLQLVHILQQQFHPTLDEDLRGLSEPPQELLERLADTAISLVTTQDRLLGSIEGLECVMLESMYHANGGSLRLSWAAGRRAQHLAQLMGFHLSGDRLRYQMLDPQSKADPSFMWFRIVHYDRYLSLILGLPQGSSDRSMALLRVQVTLCARLERVHCIIAARLLERNQSGATSHDFVLTRELDTELQKAARSLPSKWWLTPNLGNNANDDEALFWDLKQLITQMSHYNILNQLHLPYMLRSSDQHNHEHSRIACVNASREILSRFVVLRSFHRIAFNCRTSDFVALMASMTLLLAHLDSRRPSSQTGNLLAHKYLSDRAMMEQVQESMQEVSNLGDDVFSAESDDLLRRLLAIDAEAADGHTGPAEAVTAQAHGVEAAPNSENEGRGVVCVNVPYFGIIKIAREGTISREMPRPSHAPPEALLFAPKQLPATTATTDLVIKEATDGDGSAHCQQPPSASPAAPLGPAEAYSQHGLLPSISADTMQPLAQNAFFDPLLPGMTAGADDWTFQGVDMAFFDTLMGSAGGDGHLNTDGMAWQKDFT
ncbi:Uu.00g121910.m01.CDS01 [Anthostomella pinea]|uniref:Uu.00g121910.m01.CDS01 n=1 Tax=Anthostomella pinea TaxID=933095 RepID=A0AAI8VH45_9PEZI|nr:Uu.00g121910.m01.CDS01 [Anthostomella pinea]